MSASAKYTSVQPKHGERVLLCAHARGAGRAHFFRTAGMAAIGPDGETFYPAWAVCCQSCYQLAGGEFERVAWSDDCSWVGDDPIIEVGADA